MEIGSVELFSTPPGGASLVSSGLDVSVASASLPLDLLKVDRPGSPPFEPSQAACL